MSDFFFFVAKPPVLTVQTFTTSGTWVCPAGVTSVVVQCWGAGGGSNNTYNGSGGGAFASSTVSVTPGASYAYIVGAGTTGAGGATSWNLNEVKAAGGGAGTTAGRGLGGTVANSIGTTRYAGGNGANKSKGSDALYCGGGGGGAGSTQPGGNATTPNVATLTTSKGGIGGTAGGGNGGRGGYAVGGGWTYGQAGYVYGGGSGGYTQLAANCKGAQGKIIITYYA